MIKSPFYRRLTSIALGVVVLLVGWNMGRRYELQLIRSSMGFPSSAVVGSGSVLANPEKEADLSTLWAAWNLLNDSYVDPTILTSHKLELGAAEGLVRSVGDPYTVLMSPEETKQFSQVMQGSLDGIGAELTMQSGVPVIVRPIKGSPAEKAGLLPNDVIFKIDGGVTTSLSLDQVVSRIRGLKGTFVTLTIIRSGNPSPIDVRVERDHITVPSTDSKIIDSKKGKIGYVALSQFGDHSLVEIEAILQDFKKKQLKGVILDLRFNGGGYLDGAVDLVSKFVASGKVVTVDRRGVALEVINVNGSPIFGDIPLVVLVNEASASASEITAGALQDHKRATIIGKKTFGKGTVQDVIPLPDGSSLKVTVAHWLTPNGKNLGKQGVDPDIVVDLTADDYKAKKDPQLDAAVLWLNEGKKPVEGIK